MKVNAKQIAIHVICCLMFLALPYAFAPGNENSWDVMLNMFTLREFIAYLLLIGFFYLNYLVLIPRLYFSQKYIQFIAIAIVCFFVVALVPGMFIPDGLHLNHLQQHIIPPPPPNDHGLPGGHGGPPMLSAFNIFHNLFLFLVVLFIALTLKINSRLKQTEKEKVSAELSLLKAQINPHFLFNTLNSIYSLAIDNSDYTATAVVKLSGMMRYIISDAGNDYVSLDKEVTYISDYIELQKVRFDNTFELNYAVNGHAGGQQIAPLILLPFVENAFKHGVNPEEDSSIHISIDITDTQIALTVKNKKVHVISEDPSTGGLGLENTRTRLQLLYPARHQLEVLNRADDFTVNLIIQLA